MPKGNFDYVLPHEVLDEGEGLEVVDDHDGVEEPDDVGAYIGHGLICEDLFRSKSRMHKQDYFSNHTSTIVVMYIMIHYKTRNTRIYIF